jgi:hypothetical protein
VEYVRIGVVREDAKGEDGTISFCLVQFGNDGECRNLQACLSAEEIEMVVSGLQEAKKRLEESR